MSVTKKNINQNKLAEAFGVEWLTRNSFCLGGYEFDVPLSMASFLLSEEDTSDSKFYLSKTPDLIQRYLTLSRELTPKNILEHGIFRGGSTALLQLLNKPDRFLALELSTDRLDILDRFIASEKLDNSLRVEYGVDQADVDRVRSLTTEHMGPGRSIDVVIDDASHLLTHTRSSFETLFPLLRPGGSYIVEDYAAAQIALADWLEPAHKGSDQYGKLLSDCMRGGLQADHKPLNLLAVEAMLASIVAPGLVRRVVVDRHWLKIVRGRDDFEDPTAFDLRAVANDQFGLLDSKPSQKLARFLD